MNRVYSGRELKDQLNPSFREAVFIDSGSKGTNTGGRRNFHQQTPSNASANSQDQSLRKVTKNSRSASSRSVDMSQKSARSEMTENPLHFENSVVHRAAGINDAEGKSYREYDRTGRQNASM